MSPEDLVCANCWRNMFNTEAYEAVCTFDHPSNSGKWKTASYTVTVGEIRDATCNWCAYLRIFVQNSWSRNDRVTVSLTTSEMKSCSPPGSNIFYLSIDCNDTEAQWVGGSALHLHAWTAEEDHASRYVTARPMQTDIDTASARKQIKAWLQECKKHNCCSVNQSDAKYPARVIEVNPPGSGIPRIVDFTNNSDGFATLSYCWGTRIFPTLTMSDYDQYLEQLDLSALPPTFQHAISIARDLGLPYLWIDALCIIQDSEEDKMKEMAVMKHVYGKSVLTIVAASGHNVFDGIFHSRPRTESAHEIPVRVETGKFGTMFVNNLDAVCYDERFEPVAKRAWTMQEQLLARRTLTFTSNTMMWQCNAGTRNFGDSLYVPFDVDLGYSDRDDKYSLNLSALLPDEGEALVQRSKALSCWMRLVTVYSLRSASHERDKLNAIAGVASKSAFSITLGRGYYAGLWEYKLARQLTWYVSTRHRTLSDDETIVVRRTERYRAPSWSWASLEGGVVHFDFSYDDEEHWKDNQEPDVICDICECSTTPVSAKLNPLGEILDARLVIRAAGRWAWFVPSSSIVYLLPGPLSKHRSLLQLTSQDNQVPTLDETKAQHEKLFEVRFFDEDLAEVADAAHDANLFNISGTRDETVLHEPLVVLCAAIALHKDEDNGVQGIMLVPQLDEEGSKADAFRRIGHFEHGYNGDFVDNERVEMSIV